MPYQKWNTVGGGGESIFFSGRWEVLQQGFQEGLKSNEGYGREKEGCGTISDVPEMPQDLLFFFSAGNRLTPLLSIGREGERFML